MPRCWIAVIVAVLTAGCAGAPAPSMQDEAPDKRAQAPSVEPANIRRVAADLPPGYEVAGAAGVSSPAGSWGLSARWTADPPQCAALADPARRSGAPAPRSGQGVSGSGAGGIVYAVVVPLPTNPVTVEPGGFPDCGQWAMTDGRTTVGVRLVEPPHIAGVHTLGMASDTTTSAEGGTEIVSRADTFIAYLGDYYAFTTIVTDPGSTQPPLPPQFAADLLVKTVTALRG